MIEILRVHLKGRRKKADRDLTARQDSGDSSARGAKNSGKRKRPRSSEAVLKQPRQRS
jgi:hypothetical protein